MLLLNVGIKKKTWHSGEDHCHNLPAKFLEITAGVENGEHTTAQ